jgi:HlyD family secretion protein
MTASRGLWIGAMFVGLVVIGVAAKFYMGKPAHGEDPRLVEAERGTFIQVIRCHGSLQPVNRVPISPKVSGSILELAEDGSTVKEGDMVLHLDAQPYHEKLDGHKKRLRYINADWNRAEKRALKEIRQAEDIVESGKLRLTLERLRLKELESGPTEEEELNKRVALENAKSLLEARKEEYEILEELATDGYISLSESRQKRLQVKEQEVAVAQADVAYRKLHRGDPVKLGEQRLKVKEAEKAVATSQEKVEMLKGDLKRSRERHQDEVNEQMSEFIEHGRQIDSCLMLAPVPGIVLHGRGRYGRRIAPGIDIHSGSPAMILCDMRKMKALVAIDEGRIGRVDMGQRARVRLLGRAHGDYSAKVTKTAEKGHDEFEDYDSATRDLTGKANRQVFDVEVELDAVSLKDLRPDQRVEVEIEVCNLPEALVLPRTAIYRDANQDAWVYVATGAPEPERRAIEVLAEDQHSCAVKGLKLGEKVWRVRP